MRVAVDANRDLGIEVLNGAGRGISSGVRGEQIVRVLPAGTYYVALRPDESASRYRVRVLVRQVTQTSIRADGAARAKLKPGAAIRIETATTPAPGAGTTRVQADFYDVATRSWVFRKSWTSLPARPSFTPDGVGRWRVRATFRGTGTASPSRSDYANIVVATL